MRGSYNTARAVLPHFKQQKSGRILIISPPIYSRFFRGKVLLPLQPQLSPPWRSGYSPLLPLGQVGYAMTKVGMTVLVHGLAEELKDTGVAITALWPATAIGAHFMK
jgi:citronellol/citronellal dehydrogenase